MNSFRSMVFVSLMMGMFCSVASASDCNYSAATRASWVQYLARLLDNHDPSHATQMGKVASEIINGQVKALNADIDAGLSPNALLKLDANPIADLSLLTLAAAACQNAVVHDLIALGANPNGVGVTSPPLPTAAAKGDVPLITFLVQHGAKVDKVDANGQTALEAAVREHKLDAVRALLASGSNPNVVIGPGGATILDLVAGSSDPTDQAIAKELRAYGAGK